MLSWIIVPKHCIYINCIKLVLCWRPKHACNSDSGNVIYYLFVKICNANLDWIVWRIFRFISRLTASFGFWAYAFTFTPCHTSHASILAPFVEHRRVSLQMRFNIAQLFICFRLIAWFNVNDNADADINDTADEWSLIQTSKSYNKIICLKKMQHVHLEVKSGI